MGVGPLHTEEAQDVTRAVFQHATHASVRDQASLDLLRQIGVTTEIHVGADPGWLMPRPVQIELWQQFPQLSGRHIAVVVPREWPFADGWRVSLAQGLARIADAGWAILWLPFQISEHGNDLEVVGELSSRLNSHLPQAIAYCENPEEAVQIIAAADGLIAMRLHALILGLSNKVPTVALEYDDKMAVVAAAFHLEDSLRLRLADPASRYCAAMDALVGVSARPATEGNECGAELASAARVAHGALLAAIRQLPDRSISSSWRDSNYDWVTEWMVRRRVEDNKRIDALMNANVRLTSRLDIIHRSMSWRIVTPLRMIERALEILSKEGWRVLLFKIYRALSGRVIKPLFKHLARRRLRQILRAYPDRRPVLFPPIVPWNLHLFQRPHHLAKELALRGYLYFFCVPVSRHDPVLTFEEVAPGCFITPYLELVESIPGKIVHLYSTDNILPLEWIRNRLSRNDQMLYEYIDEIHEDISGHHIPQLVIEKHAYLMRNEEIACVATADKLFKEVRAVRSRNCALITNGVDLLTFPQGEGIPEYPQNWRKSSLVLGRSSDILEHWQNGLTTISLPASLDRCLNMKSSLSGLTTMDHCTPLNRHGCRMCYTSAPCITSSCLSMPVGLTCQ